MTAYDFREDKTVVLDAIKAHLLFSEGKYQLINSWNKISFPTIFYHFNFQLPHPNHIRTDQIVLARTNATLKDHKTTREIRKLHCKRFPIFSSLGAPGFPSRL